MKSEKEIVLEYVQGLKLTGVRDGLDDLCVLAAQEGWSPIFVREGRNVVLYGNPGTGKTHIATALGIKACQEGLSVLFTSVPKLLVQVREARSAKTLGILQNRFEKYDLVICDEFGYVSCDKEGGEMLFNHLSLRTGKKATIITTNLAFNRWNEIIKDKVLVAAMVDSMRLFHFYELLLQ